MSKAAILKVGLAGGAALLMLSACVSRDEVDSLDTRVSTLREPGHRCAEPGRRCRDQSQPARGGRQYVHRDLPGR